MNFCFDDLYSYRFMYDSDNDEIEISFDSYYSKDEKIFIEKKCTFTSVS